MNRRHFKRPTEPKQPRCQGCTQPIQAHPITGYLHADGTYWADDGHHASLSHCHVPGITSRPVSLMTYRRQLANTKRRIKRERAKRANDA